jgi:hypothetical protein
MNINTNNTEAVNQTRKQLSDKVIHLHNTEIVIVDSFTYLESIMNTKDDEIMEIKRILMASRTYFSIIHLFESRIIYRKNKIRIYKTIVRPILCYGCATWIMTNKVEEMLDIFERKVLRQIFDLTQDEKGWRIRHNGEIYDLYKDIKVSEFIKLKR